MRGHVVVAHACMTAEANTWRPKRSLVSEPSETSSRHPLIERRDGHAQREQGEYFTCRVLQIEAEGMCTHTARTRSLPAVQALSMPRPRDRIAGVPSCCLGRVTGAALHS